MIFIAEIVKGSYIERDWLRQRRLGGILGGVYFRKAHFRFVSDPLNEADITSLQEFPPVKISVMSNVDPFSTDLEIPLGEGTLSDLEEIKVLEPGIDKAEEIKRSPSPSPSENGQGGKRLGRPKKETIAGQKSQNAQ